MQIAQTDTPPRDTQTPSTRTGRSAIRSMLIGLGLTTVATLLALLDPQLTDSVASHVREAYPEWDASTVATERTAIIGWLVGTGILGIIGWLSSIWAVRTSRRWALWFAATWFALGLITAGLTLGTGGEAYDVIVPTPLGVVSTLPVLAGIAVLISLWRDRGTTATASDGNPSSAAT